MISRSLYKSSDALRSSIRRNKIEYTSGNAYNKRWQWKWRHTYYTQDPLNEPTTVKTPEDFKAPKMFNAWLADWSYRLWPGLKTAYERRHRMYDTFSTVVIPGSFALGHIFSDVSIGFIGLQVLALLTLSTRTRDKTIDPDFKETYLRDLIYNHPEISKLFKDSSIHVLDYDFDYDKGFPCEKEFPEFSNKLFRFFNSDTSMCSGHFVFGDVESGATMTLNFKTMPVAGKFRYQVGEPFFFYDVVAQINHGGEYKEVVVVDRADSLKKYRPFLFMF